MPKDNLTCKSAGTILPGHDKAVCPPHTRAINLIMPAGNRVPAMVQPICWYCTDRLVKSSKPGTFTFASISLVTTWREVSMANGGLKDRSTFHMCSLESCDSVIKDIENTDHVRFERPFPVCPKCAAAAKVVAVRFTDGRLYPRSLAAIYQEINDEQREVQAREHVRREQMEAERLAKLARELEEQEAKRREEESRRQQEAERARAESKRREEQRRTSEIDVFLYEQFFGEAKPTTDAPTAASDQSNAIASVSHAA